MFFQFTDIMDAVKCNDFTELIVQKTLCVVVGIVRLAQNRILLTQRQGDFMPGFWELPGGNIKEGENREQALKRELLEELAIKVIRAKLRLMLYHQYPDRCVQLWVYDIIDYQGHPLGNEGQSIVFSPLSEFGHYRLLPTMTRIMRSLTLSDYYWITPARVTLAQIEAKLTTGIKQIQWRLQRDFQKSDIVFFKKAQNLCKQYEAILCLNSANMHLKDANLHINSKLLAQLDKRPINESYLLGASVHNVQELAKAAQLEADFAVLSPILKTRSHPDTKPLGWHKAQQLIKQAYLPVYCLGGLSKAHLDQAKAIGAVGIAGINQL